MLVNHVVPASVFVIAVVQGVTPCPCQACTTADPNAPLFFVGANHDGAGSTVLAMIQASAYAARRGWNFGGALGPVQSNFGNKVWADSTARPGVPGVSPLPVLVDDPQVYTCTTNTHMLTVLMSRCSTLSERRYLARLPPFVLLH